MGKGPSADSLSSGKAAARHGLAFRGSLLNYYVQTTAERTQRTIRVAIASSAKAGTLAEPPHVCLPVQVCRKADARDAGSDPDLML